MEKEREWRELTRGEVLERLREVWELVRLDGRELTSAQSELVSYNLKLAALFSELQDARNFSSVDAIGFRIDDDEDESEDEESEV